jgi:hypothetical protein
MTAFRIIAGLCTVALLAAMVYDLRRISGSWKAAWEFLRLKVRGSLSNPGGKLTGLGNIRRIAAILSSLLFLILALTGFPPVLLFGSHLSGLLLVIHVTVAPLFALALSALAFLWADRLRFDESDWRVVERALRREPHPKDVLLRFAFKLGFWIVLTLSLPLMLSIILGLFPLFGTDGEALLIRFHGYSALLLMIAALAEIYLIIAYIEHETENTLKEQKP